MRKIFRDTNLFIYLLENEDEYAARVTALYLYTVRQGDGLFTSALTVGELLVGPVKIGGEELARRYEREIEERAIVVPFDMPAAFRFAEIRQDRSIRIPDAIQLACASAAGADVFVTNDFRLSRKTVRGIRSIRSLDAATR